MNSNYAMLLNRIKQKIQDGKFSTTTQQEKRNILRIGKIIKIVSAITLLHKKIPKFSELVRLLINIREKQMGQSRLDNSETLATLGT